jgi:hypothetical protein
MTTLMQASRQWATRPDDERFVTLTALNDKMQAIRDNSRTRVVSTRQIQVQPDPVDPRSGIVIESELGIATPTNWSFGQIASLAGAPAGYLRSLPAPLVADCMNYGLRFKRDAADIGLLNTRMDVAHPGLDGMDPGSLMAENRAATGPAYGRIWNADVTAALVSKFGDGLTGDFRVPGEFGKAVDVTKANTTIYGSDRNIFVFLADEENRIEIADRRDGKPGSLARGFFVWNSEVGSDTMGAAFFLFDYVCMNRIVWGVKEYKEIRLRHTRNAPDRWMEEIAPVLHDYSHAAAAPVEETIKLAQQAKLDTDLDEFLSKRFTGADAFSKTERAAIADAHVREEGRPIETLWDVTTGITAFAKTIPHQDARVAVERKGGKVLDLVAA